MQIQSASIRSYNHPYTNGPTHTLGNILQSSFPILFLLIQNQFFPWKKVSKTLRMICLLLASFLKCSVFNYFNKFIFNAWFLSWAFSKFFWLLYFNFSFQDFPQMRKSIILQSHKSIMHQIFCHRFSISEKRKHRGLFDRSRNNLCFSFLASPLLSYLWSISLSWSPLVISLNNGNYHSVLRLTIQVLFL